ncbi:MAG TPA: sigma-70 family RNA polymerase sigma factor [Bacteroidales bacterium]|nr:sigma-70 family RNA polymerase sigma factor [Bacteroidales bacterium]HPS61967.1 sigma-70 family RNA polymerase sigma factor [Bacteroidales bacterium]
MTDSELIEGIGRRDRVAFQYLVDQYQEKVIRTAFHFTGNMEDAEDISQEVLLDVIRHAPSFRGSSALSTWIYRITVNKVLNMIRRQQRKQLMVRLESLVSPFRGHDAANLAEPSVAGDGHETRERDELLQAALRRLPENQRIAFVLHRFDEQPYRRIAEIMNISISAVESLIHRARLNLQKYLLPHFSEYKNTP